MTDVRSLTQDEARERAALLDVERYDLEFDLTGLAEGDTLRATSTITFSATAPGAATFVDCLGEVEEAVLNGTPLPSGPPPDGRLELPDLASENVLVVRSVQRRTDEGQGVNRSVDPSDDEVYVWMSFEPDDARMVFACFDQPDLKAVFGITVHVPERWLVTSNTGDADDQHERRREHLDVRRHAADVDVRHGGQRRARSSSCAARATATTSASTPAARSPRCWSATPRSSST